MKWKTIENIKIIVRLAIQKTTDIHIERSNQ